MARFIMNVMLASGGYPWTVIRVRDRNAYLAALDSASIDLNIRPFAEFVALRVQWSLEQHDLSFPDKEARYNFDRGVVVFRAEDGKKRVRCVISREALDDQFGGDKTKNKEEVFQEHREAIEQEARRKYLAGDTEPDGWILIRIGDL